MPLPQLGNQLQDGGFDGHIQAGGGLVHHQQPGIAHQRHGDHHALLLPAGELVRVTRHHRFRIGELDLPQHGDGLFAGSLHRGFPVHHGHLHQLLADGQHRIEAAHGVLIDHGDFPAAQGTQGLAGQCGQVLPFIEHAAAQADAGPPQIVDHRVGQGGLAAAGFTDQPQTVAFLQGEADPAYRGYDAAADAIADRQIVQLQQRIGSGCSPFTHSRLSRGAPVMH